MSYRTDPQNPVPDNVVDPYGYFLNMGRARKNAEAIASGAMSASEAASGMHIPFLVDTGHPYQKTVRQVRSSHMGLNYKHQTGTGATQVRYGGPLICVGGELSSLAAAPIFPLSSGGSRKFGYMIPAPASYSIVADGQDALTRVAPSSSDVDLFRASVEILRDFPRLVGIQLFNLKDSWLRKGAGEFLNYMFGVTPTVQDLAKLADLLMEISQRIWQYRRDAGRAVRRSFDWEDVDLSQSYTSSDLSNQGSIFMAYPFQDFGFVPVPDVSTRVVYQTFETTELQLRERVKRHFSGAFTYYIPASPGLIANYDQYAAAYHKMVNTAPTLRNAWQLTRWSWLVDWFVDVSTSLRMAEIATDSNLVVNYAYQTQTTTREVRVSRRASGASAGRTSYGTVHTIASLYDKRRIRGNPYGFILPTDPALNPVKWAILGALGISRLA